MLQSSKREPPSSLADDRSGSVPVIVAVVLVVVIAVVAIVLITRGGETVVETAPVTDPPPEGWDELSEPDCWEGTSVNPDTSRCIVGGDPGAEYIYVSQSNPHSAAPLPQISYVHVAVPDAVSDELVGRVFDSYVASQSGFGDIAQFQLEETDSPLGPGGQLGMDLFIVRNYSDVVFGDYFHGRDFTGDPRVIYATGPGEVAHGYNPVSDQDSSYGTVVHESGRDGADLPEDCIASDFSFRILSQSTTDQLEAYYSAGSPFMAALSSYIELGGVYGLSLPESAQQKRLRGMPNTTFCSSFTRWTRESITWPARNQIWKCSAKTIATRSCRRLRSTAVSGSAIPATGSRHRLPLVKSPQTIFFGGLQVP